MGAENRHPTIGPYRAADIRPGEPYELSDGHKIECMGTGQRGSRSNGSGFMVLDSDPEAPPAGVDAGVSPVPTMLRAPDVSVGGLANEPGWSSTAPPLAVEYADRGQDEPELQKKIVELLRCGTQFVWVVRLAGPRRVEVYAPGKAVLTVLPGGTLAAPGILKNTVPIEALYDRDAAHRQTLRNLLQREGYESLEAVKEETRLVDARSALRARARPAQAPGRAGGRGARRRLHGPRRPGALARPGGRRRERRGGAAVTGARPARNRSLPSSLEVDSAGRPMGAENRYPTVGPYRAADIRPGEPYELSDGHKIECMGTGQRGSRSNGSGFMVLDSDPEAPPAGVDAGVSPVPTMLRAPDVSVGGLANEPGWSSTAPPLAVEYADRGQDEPELQKKIVELLRCGTQFVWVVRLAGPRRVEVYAPGKAVLTVLPGGTLAAPGILKNTVPIEALYDRDAAHRQTLRNLLQREGYESLEAVKEEGVDAGRLVEARSALRRVLARRKLQVAPADEARVAACTDLAALERWLDQAVDAASAAEALR